MKLLMISTRFHPHIGGVENVVEYLAKAFTGQKVKTNVLTSLNSRFFEVEGEETLRDGYSVKRIWMSVPRSKLGYLAFIVRFPLSIAALYRYIKTSRPDVINFHFPDDASLYVWIISKVFRNIPIVTSIHGNDIMVFARMPGYKFFISKLLMSSQKILVNSTYMKEEVAKYNAELKNKVVIIPNGLDLEYINSVPQSKIFKESYIFFVGRLVKKKGADILIKAFSKANIPDLKLVIEGLGDELEYLKTLVGHLQINDKVLFTEGKLTHDQKIGMMKGAVFGVMPSRNEPFGIVSLEFLAAGVPLIASKTGGLIDLLDDQKSCLFFENENVDDLVSKISEMYANSGLRMRLSVNGLDLVEKYGWNKISLQYINVFKQLI